MPYMTCTASILCEGVEYLWASLLAMGARKVSLADTEL